MADLEFFLAVHQRAFMRRPAGAKKVEREAGKLHRLAGKRVSCRHAKHVAGPSRERSNRIVRERRQRAGAGRLALPVPLPAFALSSRGETRGCGVPVGHSAGPYVTPRAKA